MIRSKESGRRSAVLRATLMVTDVDPGHIMQKLTDFSKQLAAEEVLELWTCYLNAWFIALGLNTNTFIISRQGGLVPHVCSSTVQRNVV